MDENEKDLNLDKEFNNNEENQIKISNDTIGISARSLGDIDVSVIMKEMGGGGHNSNAATQIKDKTLKEVKQLVIDIVNNKEESNME